MAFVTMRQFEEFRGQITTEMNSTVGQFKILLEAAERNFNGMEQRLNIFDKHLDARIRDLDESKNDMGNAIRATQLRAEEAYSKVLMIESDAEAWRNGHGQLQHDTQKAFAEMRQVIG